MILFALQMSNRFAKGSQQLKKRNFVREKKFMKWWTPPRPTFIILWFSRQKCEYVIIFATKECVCCDFWDKRAYFVIIATKICVCCDFHDNSCVFGITCSSSSGSQVFSAHTCTIHWILPTKTVKKGLFRFWEKIRFYEIW